MKNRQNLIQGFLESARKFAERPALTVDGRTHSYAGLAREASRVARAMDRNAPASCGAVLAHNSLAAYAGILGTLISGRAYVPLHPSHPVQRTARILNASECDTLVGGEEAIQLLDELLPFAARELTIILPSVEDTVGLPERHPRHRFITGDALPAGSPTPEAPASGPDDIAYVIFTSGSTGVPKGVPVSNANVIAYVRYMVERFPFNEADRFSITCDLTFDLSIHPLWVCWESGACLYSVPDASRWAPGKFIRDHGITSWTSVPLAVMVMKRLRMLGAGSFPTVRYSMFCGEALLFEWAAAWQDACPYSIVDNLYGPTEATCAVLGFQWDGLNSLPLCENGIVPIGTPFPNHRAVIIDEYRNLVAAGEEGELCMSGPQVTKGYLNDPAQTSEKFIRIPALGDGTWYRTGDLARQAPDGCCHFIGRTDFQVKVMGHRIELQEVEHAIRQGAGSGTAVCLPWPVADGVAQGIVAFIGSMEGRFDESAVREHCARVLPHYMVPGEFRVLSSLPRNANGKIDRAQLLGILQEGKVDE